MKKKRIKVLISAGPTREPIDPVRFISNYSTGILGFQIASQAKRRGHRVTLVSGKTCLKAPAGVKIIRVETALEMQRALLKEFENNDCLIMNAAVCDYRPSRVCERKIKKGKEVFSIRLVKNPDILENLSRRKKNKLLVGFAVETQDLIKNASDKLKKKKLDLIVASKVGKRNFPFGPGKLSVYVIEKQGKYQKIADVTKRELSQKLLDRVEALWYTNSQKLISIGKKWS